MKFIFLFCSFLSYYVFICKNKTNEIERKIYFMLFPRKSKSMNGIASNAMKNQPLPKLSINQEIQTFVDDIKALPISFSDVNDFIFEEGSNIAERGVKIFNGVTQNTLSILNSYSFNPTQIIRTDANNEPIFRPCLNIFSKVYFTYFKSDDSVEKASEGLFQYVIPFKEPMSIHDVANIGEIKALFTSDVAKNTNEKFVQMSDLNPYMHPFAIDSNGNYVLNMNQIDFDEIFYEEGKALLPSSILSTALTNSLCTALGEYLLSIQSSKMLDIIDKNQDLTFSLDIGHMKDIATKVANGVETLNIDSYEELGKAALIGVSFLKDTTIGYMISDLCSSVFKNSLILPLQSLIDGLVMASAVDSKKPILISEMGTLKANNYSFSNLTEDEDGFAMDVSFIWDVQKFFEIQCESFFYETLMPIESQGGVSSIPVLEDLGELEFKMGSDIQNLGSSILYEQIPLQNKYKCIGSIFTPPNSSSSSTTSNNLNLISPLSLKNQEGSSLSLSATATIALYDNFKNNLDASIRDALTYNLNVFGLDVLVEQAKLKVQDIAKDLNIFDASREKNVGTIIMQPLDAILKEIAKNVGIVDNATIQIATDTEVITEMQIKELGTPYSKEDYKVDNGIIPPKEDLEPADIVDISERGVEKFDQKIFDEAYNRINENAKVVDNKLKQIDDAIGDAENEIAKAKEDATTVLSVSNGDKKIKKPSKEDRARIQKKFEDIENDLARLRKAEQTTRDNLGQILPSDQMMDKLDRFRVSKVTKKMESANVAKVFFKFLLGTGLVLGSYYLFFRKKNQMNQNEKWNNNWNNRNNRY